MNEKIFKKKPNGIIFKMKKPKGYDYSIYVGQINYQGSIQGELMKLESVKSQYKDLPFNSILFINLQESEKGLIIDDIQRVDADIAIYLILAQNNLTNVVKEMYKGYINEDLGKGVNISIN